MVNICRANIQPQKALQVMKRGDRIIIIIIIIKERRRSMGTCLDCSAEFRGDTQQTVLNSANYTNTLASPFLGAFQGIDRDMERERDVWNGSH